MEQFLQEIKSLPQERLDWLLHFWIVFPSTFDHKDCYTVALLNEKQNRIEYD